MTDESLELEGRESVFSRVTDFAYVPRGAGVTVASDAGARVALCGALAERALPFRYGRAEDVPVEVRGAGSASRQCNNFCAPDAFETDRLVSVEVLVPGGNWASYPPHKHDEAREGEAQLEEIYYFEVAGGAGAGEPGPGGYQRVYTSGPGREIDVLAEVKTGDVVLIPYGYHGPTMAAPGYDLYFLNVLAGPASERTMAFCDDPAHAWVRASWRDQEPRPEAAHDLTPRRAVRLTVAQALVRFLAAQEVERDGERHRFFAGCLGIFGHGNVAGLGQALLEAGDDLPYYLARNEQAMVHTAVGLRAHVGPAARLRLHHLDRPGRDESRDRCRGRHHQPHPGAAAARRRLRHPPCQPGPPRARGPDQPRRLGQRLPAPGLALLRSGLAARAAGRRPAQRDARPHRPSRDRRGHPGAAPGPRHRGLRGARRASRATRMACPAPAGRARAPRRRRRDGPRVAPAAPRRRGRGHLLGRHRGARAPGRTPPDCRSPRPRQARARCATTTRRAWGRSGRPGRPPPTRSRATPTS